MTHKRDKIILFMAVAFIKKESNGAKSGGLKIRFQWKFVDIFVSELFKVSVPFIDSKLLTRKMSNKKSLVSKVTKS